MEIELISQCYTENQTEFEINTLKKRWDTLILVTEGVYEIYLKEKQKRILLQKGDIMLLPAGIEIDRDILSPLSCYYISFCAQADHTFYLSATVGKLKLPEEQRNAIFKTLESAFVLPDNRDLMVHIVEHIFAESYLFGKKDMVKFKPFSKEVEKAIKFMRENFHKRIDIDELAEQVSLSHSGLIWKFKNELNTTPSNYLGIMRLRYAKQLLLNYHYSITEISEMCGYSNPYYFTNTFHRAFGMSPTDFRKHYLK